MAWVVEARDPYTGGHLWRVARYSQLLAERAGLSRGEVARMALGGFLHDLGKVGIPDAILRKPARLTEEEYEVVKTHPEVGARILAGHPLGAWVVDAVRLHHERPDGRGYPLGIQDVPAVARVVGICDAFDAMTSTRPYQPKRSVAEALAVIRSGLGMQFDATFGAHFVALGEAGELDGIAGHSDDGIPLRECLMCGPTLVVRREQGEGEEVVCPSCMGVHRLEPVGGALDPRPIGRRARADEASPRPDLALIARLVREYAEALST